MSHHQASVGPSELGLSWGSPRATPLAGQMTPASGCSPGRMARGPHSAMATRTKTAVVTSPARPCPSGAGKASADSLCSHQPHRGQGGVTRALGFLLPCRPRRAGWSPAQTYVPRAAADGPVMYCVVLGRKLAAGGRAVAETTRGHTE